MNKKILAGMAGLVALSMSGTASAFLIDDFNAPPVSIFSVNAGTPNDGGDDAGQGVGGNRNVDVNYVSGPLGGNAGVVGGEYNHSSDAGTQIRSKLTWDANGAGLGGVDLTDGLINGAFQFTITDIDQGNVDIKISVQDTISLPFVEFTATNLGVGLETVAFSNFGGVDFTSINSIMLEVIQNADASDLSLDIFDTTGDRPPSGVPVPAAVWLFGTGLLGLTGITRRKKA